MKLPIYISILLIILTSCSPIPQNDCQQFTCEDFTLEYGEPNYNLAENQIYTVLVIDSSKSMEGTYIDETKLATQKVIQKKLNNEYFAIVEFNEQAQIISEFTNDKQQLIDRLQVIDTKGRTKFLDSFLLTKELLFEKAPEKSQKYVIILSDGSPEDDEEIFLEVIDELKEERIPIYTIAFGEESNKDILEQIASRKEYLYSVGSASEVENTFSTIYEDIQDIPLFSYTTAELSSEYFVGQQTQLQTKVFSSFNQEEISLHNICGLETSSELEIIGENFLEKVKATIEENTLLFTFGSGLKKGSYDLYLSTNYKLDECEFSSKQHIETISFVEKKQSCTLNCSEINSIIKDDQQFAYKVERPAKSWIILLDKSSSMSEQRLLEQAIETVTELAELKPRKDSLSLIVFDGSSSLKVNHSLEKKGLEKELKEIFPGTATKLLPALKLASTNALDAPYSSREIVVLTDGNNVDFSNDFFLQIKSLLNEDTCLTTIHYGTFLLNNQERRRAFQEVADSHCGTMIITQPTITQLENLLDITRVNASEALEISFSIDTDDSRKGIVEIYSRYTKEKVFFRNETCQIQPTVKLTTSESKSQELPFTTSYEAILDNVTELTISANFGLTSCQYLGTYEQTIQEEHEKKKDFSKLILSLLIILLVTVISFIITLKVRLKRLSDKLPPQLKK